MLLIGNPHNRRTTLMREALDAVGVPLTVVGWRELLAGEPEEVLSRARLAGSVWCKIDSPGEDAEVTDALIARGHALMSGAPAPHPLRHGELAYQHWWFAGFADLLSRLAAPLATLRLLNAVGEILTMCDKWACQLHLREQGIPIPELLGQVSTFEELEASLPVTQYPAVFIKARYGSSAAGVIALRRHPAGHRVAYSSARLDPRGDIYNHLQISRYTDRTAITTLVDALARQGAYVERWIPKPRAPVAPEACYDLRVVAGAGKARQRVARMSTSPMTNLHLGNERSSPHWLGEAEVARLEATIERAAAAFPASRCIGFDVCMGREVTLFEANAFGDLLPGLRYPEIPQGLTTYEDQALWVSQDER